MLLMFHFIISRANSRITYQEITNGLAHTSIICFIIGFFFGIFDGFKNLMQYVVVMDFITIMMLVSIYLLLIRKKITINVSVVLLCIISISNLILTYPAYINLQLNINAYILRDVILIIILIFTSAFCTNVYFSTAFCVFAVGLFLLLGWLINDQSIWYHIPNICLFVLGVSLFFIVFNKLIESLIGRIIKAKEEIDELSTFKQNMVELIVHDLKVPINAIHILSYRNADERLVQINYQAHQMSRQIEDILDIERIEHPSFKLVKGNYLVSVLLKDAVKSMEYMALNKNISIQIVDNCNVSIRPHTS